MSNIKLTDEVRVVLEKSTIQGNVLILPDEQLPRPLYDAVNKVIVNCGGKWKRGTGHVFNSDPTQKLGITLATGESIDEKKKYQAFFTPQQLAVRVVQMASVEGKRVLEPSAGSGVLVRECLLAGAAYVDAIEINDPKDQEEKFWCNLIRKRCTLKFCDFLNEQPRRIYDRVVMNPPFSKKQDLKHVGHAKQFLKAGGSLVAIMQGNRTAAEIREYVGWDCSIILHPLDAGEFKESGTNIQAQIIIIL